MIVDTSALLAMDRQDWARGPETSIIATGSCLWQTCEPVFINTMLTTSDIESRRNIQGAG